MTQVMLSQLKHYLCFHSSFFGYTKDKVVLLKVCLVFSCPSFSLSD